MVRHKITTYAMLTPEHRFKLQEDIRLRRAARVVAGMSPDSPGPEEIGEVEEVEGGARPGIGMVWYYVESRSSVFGFRIIPSTRSD